MLVHLQEVSNRLQAYVCPSKYGVPSLGFGGLFQKQNESPESKQQE
jgi:hypothetical protein